MDNHPLLKKFISTIPKNSQILSLNYDCILDQGLYLANRWSPFGGYYYHDPALHPQNENDLKDKILLLKLHGSCNFRDAEKDQEYPNVEITHRIFPNTNAHINSSGKTHILIMSYIKQFHNDIMMLWREAISFLREAEKLVVVGCSLREEDTFLRFALYHFGMKNNTNQFNIDIVDIGEKCQEIEEKIMNLVAYRDKQRVFLFDGLEDYLNRTQQATSAEQNS